jgi:hypothetical protein
LAEVGLPAGADADAILSLSNPDESAQLALALGKRKKLTAFQAQDMYQGKARQLVFGGQIQQTRSSPILAWVGGVIYSGKARNGSRPSAFFCPEEGGIFDFL